MRTHTKETQASLTPKLALDFLVEGNQRFVGNLKVNRNLLEQVNTTSQGQFPFATILSCIDSRTSAELIFDQGLGDIFSVRIAGNVLNDDILGSMEFACKLAGSKLLVVLGHTSCGAVKGACSGAKLGHLTGLLGKIRAANAHVSTSSAPAPEVVDQVAHQNVLDVVNEILERSPVLSDLVQAGSVGIVGGMYSVVTGEVQFEPMRCGS